MKALILSFLFSASVLAQPGAVMQRFACGLPAGVQSVTDSSGVVWSSDSSIAQGGFAFTIANPPAGLEPVFRNMRYSAAPFSFRLPVAPGSYTLTLLMIEPAAIAPGGRAFTITVNGTPAVYNFDLFSTAGTLAPFTVRVPVNVTGSSILIALTTQARNAVISGIALDSYSVIGDTSLVVAASQAISQTGKARSVIASSNNAGVMYLASMSPTMLGYSENQMLTFLPNVSCADNPALNLDGLGPIQLVKLSGAALVPLSANDCIGGMPYILIAHGNPVSSFVLK